MMKYVIGLDVGTTAAKALAVAADGRVLAEKSFSYELITSGCCIEQRAEDWIEAARVTLRDISARLPDAQPQAIALSTQGASTAAVDAQGMPIGNAITWMDTRSDAEAKEIEGELGGEYIYRTSGWRINPVLDAAKIRHMKRDPFYAGAKKYLSTLEIVNVYLTGNDVIDPSNAAIRQLFDVERGVWDEKLMAAAGVTEAELPRVLPTGALVGGLSARAAAETGLPEGLPVYNGALDQYCASLGAGAVHEGDLLLSAGTTWALVMITRKPVFTASFVSPGKHPEEGLYGALVSLVCSGASLQWFKNGFLPEDFDEMNRIVAQRRDKTRDLCFYPYMAGANYPIWNQKARGAFTGLTIEHDRFDLARAIMEGVAFGVRRAMDDFKANGAELRRITIMGGAANSDVWCQMIADVAGVPICRLNVTDVCALGAAGIAMKSAGLSESFAEAASRMVHPEREFMPDPESQAYYCEKFERFDKMWGCMRAYYEE